MKVRITYNTPDAKIDRVVEGRDADAVVAAIQQAAAAEANFAVRLLIKSMGPLPFAQEVVRRYNAAAHRSVPLPASCAQFIEQGRAEGIVTILEP